MHGRPYDDYRLEKASKSGPKTLFGYMELKNKCVGNPSVMHFEGSLTSGSDDICNLFADFILTYADDIWLPSDPGPDFTVYEVQSFLLELDVNKGASNFSSF
jgi:hypothetical protein